MGNGKPKGLQKDGQCAYLKFSLQTLINVTLLHSHSYSSHSHFTTSFVMTGAAETSLAKARLTIKEKGKGKRKRPPPITQVDAGDDQNEDVVDTTKRQFTRRTRSKSRGGAQALVVSHLESERAQLRDHRLQPKGYRPDLLISPYHQLYSTTKT